MTQAQENCWWLSIDWFEACEDISTTHGYAAELHWYYLLLWAAIPDIF